jgi:hypothetical protein
MNKKCVNAEISGLTTKKRLSLTNTLIFFDCFDRFVYHNLFNTGLRFHPLESNVRERN